ncbi:MAG: hypothetical protein VYC91_04140 [Acidobacteriota bacterium]|nr:hypothetical protein [Acidobacteriota bacterium]
MDRARVKKVVFSIVTLVLSSIFCLVTLEIFARFLEPKVEMIGQQGEHASYAQLHPIMGWTLVSQPIRHRTFEFDVTYNLTTHLMNDEWSAADASKKRIVALGDSQTFGWGLPSMEAWPNALEQDLNGSEVESGTPPVVVYNLGVPSYGIDHNYLRLREDGWRLDPSLVLLGFSPNDLTDIQRVDIGRSRFTVDQDTGSLVEKTGPLGESTERVSGPAVKSSSFSLVQLLQHSRLVRQLVRTSAFYWFSSRFQEATGISLWPTKEGFFRKIPNVEEQHAWELIQKLLERTHADCEARGVPLVVVFIPHLYHVYDELWNSTLGNFPADYDRMIMNKKLADLVDKANGHFVDPTAALKRFVETTGTRVNFRFDGHVNSKGAEIIAREVTDYLVQHNLLAEKNESH